MIAIFVLGLVYLYCIEFVLGNIYFDTQYNYLVGIVSIFWVLLWVLAFWGMFHVRKMAFETVDDLYLSEYLSEDQVNYLKDGYLHRKATIPKLKVKIKIRHGLYFVCLMILFVGMMNSFRGNFDGSQWDFQGGSFLDEGPNAFGYPLVIIYWAITVPLAIIIIDFVAALLLSGPMTAEISRQIKGKVDFYNKDSHAGLKKMGIYIDHSVFLYFTSLVMFSVLSGFYILSESDIVSGQHIDLFICTVLIAAWAIGLGLIALWHLNTDEFVHEEKKRRLGELQHQIEHEDKDKQIAYRQEFIVVQNTKVHIIHWNSIILIPVPLIIEVGTLAVNYFKPW